MDFGIIYQLKTKKFWWMDTILYFVIALLLATVFCFFIFSFKISFESKNLKDVEGKIAGTGTSQQKELEKEVFEYQKKIDSFATILSVHKIPTNILKKIEELTLQNVWFNSFTMVAKNAEIQVKGETDDVPSLSRQLQIFESQDFIREVTGLTFSLAEAGKINFSFNLTLDPVIFFPEPEAVPLDVLPGGILDTTSPSTSAIFNQPIF